MKFSDEQSKFLLEFNFVILCYSRNSQKLDARKKLVFYSISIFPLLSYQPIVYMKFDQLCHNNGWS